MLGQLPRQQQAYSRLDFPGRDSGALVIMSQARRLACDALENVTDKRIHDAHGLGGDADVGVYLLQQLIDVHGVGFFAPAAPSGLLVPRTPAAPAPHSSCHRV